MSSLDEKQDFPKERNEQGNGHNRVWIALTLVVVGSALFLQQVGIPLPYWLFSWQMLLIVIGIFQGFNHGFRGPGWAILIIVGGVFLIDDFMPGFSFHRFMWPLAIIGIGIIFLIRPRNYQQAYRRKREPKWDDSWKDKWREREQQSKAFEGSNFKDFSSDDYIDATTVFGGIQKTIVSKNFKGGEITVFMGGTEINLSQADIQGTATLDITQIMGGTKLIVPSHWEIRSQITSVFGNIEDKRQQDRVSDPQKILILHGTSVFGGIEIRNF